MRGPEQDAPPPQIGPPGGRIDRLGKGVEPAAHQIFGDGRTLRPRRDGRQVAQPGEAVQMIGETARPVGMGEIDRFDPALLAAPVEDAAEQRMTALHIAQHRVLGYRHQFQRMPPLQPQRMERGAPGQPVQMLAQPVGERQPAAADPDQPLAFLDAVGALRGRAAVRRFAHSDQPRRAAMLAAYCDGPPRKAAVPATSASAPASIQRLAQCGSTPPSTSRSMARPE